MDKKILINASISYFFLWELFIFAKSNPNFNHTFIISHSKNAIKIHLIFFVMIAFYSYFLSSYFYGTIPIISITFDEIIKTVLFAAFIFILIRWAYKAFHWIEADNIKVRKDIFKFWEEMIWENLSETQKTMYIFSYVPFFWTMVASKHPWALNEYWEKISWSFSMLMALLISIKSTELLSIFLLIYIAYVAYVWINIIVYSKIIYSDLFAKIPNLQEIYVNLRASVYYIFESLKVIFWKKEELSFMKSKEKIMESDKKFHDVSSEFLTSKNMAFTNKLIFIPIINLLYIIKYFIDKKSIYVFAIAQWVIISFLIVGLYFLDWFYFYSFQIFFLFPIILWIANIDSNPFYKIPIIYEIYSILDKLSFWIFNKMKFLKEKKIEVKEVSFKV